MNEGKARTPGESEEQIALFRWAALMRQVRWPELRLLYHVPNGGYRTKAEAGRFRAQGVKSGVPDIVLPVARGGYHGLYVELKRTEGGKVSKTQEEWLEALSGEGYCTAVCLGWDEARQVIERYLAGKTVRDE